MDQFYTQLQKGFTSKKLQAIPVRTLTQNSHNSTNKMH